jgi:predicted amidohydrolase YtcJ
MRVPRFFGLIVFAIAVLASATRAEADDAAERVFYNARIFTAETEHPYAEAVAIRGDKIAVGSRADVEKKVGKQAERIDLHGQWLLPGFIDSHTHSAQGGLSLISADVGDKVQSIDDLVAFVGDARKSGKGMRGNVLSISGMPLAFWPPVLGELLAGVHRQPRVLIRQSGNHSTARRGYASENRRG